MPRKPKALPDHFTAEEAQALVAAAPGYPTRMAMRIMLRTGLRVSECLSLRPADLRLSQDPPISSLRREVTGNKSKRGRDVPIPAGLVESLGDLALIHAKNRGRPSRLAHWQAASALPRLALGLDVGPPSVTLPSPSDPGHCD